MELDQQRIPVTINPFSRSHANPAFADAILLDILLLRAVKSDPHVAFKNRFVIVRAFRIDAEAVWKFVWHDSAYHTSVVISLVILLTLWNRREQFWTAPYERFEDHNGDDK